jgi:putative lipase involved disintegration of autophagic bodies
MPLYAIKYKIGDVVQTVHAVAENEANALVDSQIVVDAYCPDEKCIAVQTDEMQNGSVIVYYQAVVTKPESVRPKPESRIILTGHSDKVQ